MSEKAENTETAKTSTFQKSASAGFRKLVFVVGVLFIFWLVFGALIPRFFIFNNPPPLATGSNATKTSATLITGSDNQPLKRQSFQEMLDEKGVQLNELRNRVTQLETQMKMLEAGGLPQADMSNAKNSKDNVIHTESLTRLQNELKTLQEKLNETEADRQRITQVEGEAKKQQETLKQQLDMFKQQQEAFQQQQAAFKQQQEAFKQQQDAVKHQQDTIKTIRTEIAHNQIKAAHHLSAFSSFIPLKKAVDQGQPFDMQLTQLLQFSEGNRTIEELAGKLKPIAKEGTPSFSVLQGEFGKLLPEALKATDPSGSFTRNMKSLIMIRKTGEQPGVNDEAIMARAENRLAQNDISACLKELEQLSAPAKNTMAPWVEKAKRHLHIHDVMDALQVALTQNIPAVQPPEPLPEAPAKVIKAEPATAEVTPANVTTPPPPAAEKPKAEPAAPAADAKPAADAAAKPAEPAATKPVVISKPAPKPAPKKKPDPETEEEPEANSDSE
jgi:hypothetical protein